MKPKNLNQHIDAKKSRYSRHGRRPSMWLQDEEGEDHEMVKSLRQELAQLRDHDDVKSLMWKGNDYESLVNKKKIQLPILRVYTGVDIIADKVLFIEKIKKEMWKDEATMCKSSVHHNNITLFFFALFWRYIICS